MKQPAIWLGVSLKMYFSYQQTLEWSRAVADVAREHPAIKRGDVGLFILPAFPALLDVKSIFTGTPVRIGAQDICHAENGAWTGEVSGSMLAEIGCTLAEIGHAERRRYFFEDDATIAAKVAISLRHKLTPVLCLGEPDQVDTQQAIAICTQQVEAYLQTAQQEGLGGEVILAYEPQWAIGAPQPAPDAYIREVCAGLKTFSASNMTFRVIYGGSAGPGLLKRLGGDVEGLFLGRFAHDPVALHQIIEEAAALAAQGV